MNIVLAIVVFSILIISHELGHFLIAKKNGIGVTEFSIGMGPRLLKYQGKETLYSIKVFPFGGSCMMVGDIDDDEEAPNQMAENSFSSKSPWARFSTLAAGPIFNFLLAFVLAVIVIGNVGIDLPVLSGTIEGLPAEASGLMAGDLLVSVNGKKVNTYRDFSLYLSEHTGELLEIEYMRDNETNTIVIQPEYSEEHGSYMIGIEVMTARTKTTALETIKFSLNEVKFWMQYTVFSLKQLVTGQVSSEDLSGPVGIVNMVSDMVEESKADGFYYVFLNLANLSILLSVNLGVLNLLPIPALDGGRILFIIIELIRGKPVDREKEGIVHIVGMALLMILMVFVLFNDIKKFF